MLINLPCIKIAEEVHVMTDDKAKSLSASACLTKNPNPDLTISNVYSIPKDEYEKIDFESVRKTDEFQSDFKDFMRGRCQLKCGLCDKVSNS